MKKWCSLCGLVVFLGLVPIVLAQPVQDKVSGQVARIVAQVGDPNIETCWPLVDRLQALGPGVVEALLPYRSQKGKPGFRVAVAAVLIHYGEKDAGIAMLLDLAADEGLDREIRSGALRVLGQRGDRSAGIRLKQLLDDTLDPLLKLEIARALWNVSFNHRPEAKNVLRGFLRSEDPDLRAAGALALAEFDDFDAARNVLEELRDEPTPRGQLACSYLRTMDDLRQLEDALFKNTAVTGQNDKFDILAEVLGYIRSYHLTGNQRTERELVQAAVRSILRALDSQSVFLTADQRVEMQQGEHRDALALGAFIDFDPRGILTVMRVFPGGAMERAGFRAGDRIIEIEGWSTFDRDRLEIGRRLAGSDGSRVKLKVVRRGWSEARTVTVERRRCTTDAVAGERLPGHVGYVSVARIGGDAARRLDEVLARLQGQGARGLILDLRDSHGEDVQIAGDIVDRFLEPGKLVVYWEGRNRFVASRREVRTAGPAVCARTPLVVLVNERSGPAAEVVAGALGFYERAVVVGERTPGQGSLQKVFDLVSEQGDRFTDLARTNGVRDPDEPFTDRNGNGRHDPGEPFEDRPRKNGVWDPGEPYTDQNRNGRRDKTEPFEDRNGNGAYDGPEPFEDRNKNGRYDVGPGVRITIARYYLPDGTSILREYDADGKVTNEGGVKPTVEAAPSEWPGWKEEELDRILKSRQFETYLDREWPQHRDRLETLAAFDGGDPGRYPDFEAFLKSLNTQLDRDDVRRWLRVFLRRRVSTSGGTPFLSMHSTGDFQDDAQLQTAITALLKRFEPPVDPATIPEYAGFKKDEKDGKDGKDGKDKKEPSAKQEPVPK